MSALTAPLPQTARADSLRILAGALPDPAWLPEALRDQAISTPAWQGWVDRASCIEEALSPPQALAEPGHLRLLAQMHGLRSAAAWSAFEFARRHDLPLNTPIWRLVPVHFLLGRDHVRLTDPTSLALETAQASALHSAVLPLFLEAGLELTMHSPQEWSMRAREPAAALQLDTCSLAGAIGRSIDARLPSGPDARRWRRLLNEVQMTWFSHAVNPAREAQGLWPVNGLWLEGPAGEGPGSEGPAGESLAAGLTPARAIALDERLHQAQLSGDPQRWVTAWQSVWSEPQPPFMPGMRLALTGDAGWRILEFGAPQPWWKRRLPWRLRAFPGAAPARPVQAARRWLGVEPT